MRQEPSFFDGSEPRLVYIARKLRDALELEARFTEAGIDYGVEPDRYRGGFLFQTERVGAFFYVQPETEGEARRLLESWDFRAVPAES